MTGRLVTVTSARMFTVSLAPARLGTSDMNLEELEDMEEFDYNPLVELLKTKDDQIEELEETIENLQKELLDTQASYLALEQKSDEYQDALNEIQSLVNRTI